MIKLAQRTKGARTNLLANAVLAAYSEIHDEGVLRE